MGNLGVVPGIPRRAYETYGADEWVDRWAADLENEFKQSERSSLESLLVEFDQAYGSGASVSSAARDIAGRIMALHLRKYGDAGWDPVLQKLEYVADSVVYPDKRVSSETEVPGLPEPEVIDLLAGAGVQMVLGGHVPVGDGLIVRLGHSQAHDRMVRFVMLDTSYSPVEGRQVVRIDPDGSILARIRTRDGLDIVIDLPCQGRLSATDQVIDDIQKSGVEQTDFSIDDTTRIARQRKLSADYE